MAEIKVERKEHEMVVVINGALTIEYAVALKNALEQALKDGERVVLDLSKVTEADLSCLQLLCSAHRTSVARKKSVELYQGGPGILKQVAREAGFSRMSSCVQGMESGCFWRGL